MKVGVDGFVCVNAVHEMCPDIIVINYLTAS